MVEIENFPIHKEFKRAYENIIIRGQDAGCTQKDRDLAAAKVTLLTNIVNQCLIRRTNQILTKYLPVKFEMVICVRMSDIQKSLYKSFLASDLLRKNILGKKQFKRNYFQLIDSHY